MALLSNLMLSPRLTFCSSPTRTMKLDVTRERARLDIASISATWNDGRYRADDPLATTSFNASSSCLSDGENARTKDRDSAVVAETRAATPYACSPRKNTLLPSGNSSVRDGAPRSIYRGSSDLTCGTASCNASSYSLLASS